MSSRDWNRELRRVLLENLEPLGFIEDSPLCFAREHSECVDILNFGGRVDKNRFKFTCTVGVRFPVVEARLRPDNNDTTYPTVSTPIHLLREDREYYEWEASEAESLPDVISDVIAEIQNSAMEFFHRFSSLESVEEELSSSETTALFALSPLQRTGVLAAIALCSGRRADAEATLSHAFNELRNSSSGKRRRIEQLKAQLLTG